MKSRKFLALTLALSLIAATSIFKVDICHNVDNNPHTINIAWPAAVAHLFQHPYDDWGSCGSSDDSGDAR
jgi:hypothetical protein